MVTYENYRRYYFTKDGNAYYIHSYFNSYALYDIGVDLRNSHADLDYRIAYRTFQKLLQEIKKLGYTAILQKDYDKMENCVHFSYTEQNFLNSVLKVIKDNPETTHYCKNICNSILKKI